LLGILSCYAKRKREREKGRGRGVGRIIRWFKSKGSERYRQIDKSVEAVVDI
jgi:hypothetical protein